MKIAVISDIHGNLQALEAVLEDIHKRNVDSIICLGDIVGKGPDSLKTLEICRQECKFIVKGNWEELLCDYYFSKKNDIKTNSRSRRKWYCDSLGRKNMDYINSLPHVCEIFLGKKLVRLFHAHPINFSRYFADSSEEKRLELLGYNPKNTIMHKKSDIAVYADIHTAYMQEIDYSLLLNVGSVGNPLDIPVPSYVILECNDEGIFSIQFIRVPYDVEKAINMAEKSGMPDLNEYITELKTAKYCRRY